MAQPFEGSFKDQFATHLVRDALRNRLAHRDARSLPKSHVNTGKLIDGEFYAPVDGPSPDYSSKDLKVCIIGAGIAGLYTAYVLDVLGIDYELVEASSRVGGRLLTHYFSDPAQAEITHDYYDIGAMRFPETNIMKRTFDLFRIAELNLLPYYMKSKNQPTRYNDITTFELADPRDQVQTSDHETFFDPYHVSVLSGGPVPNQSVKNADTILNDAYDWYRMKIKRDPKTGFQYLLKHDKFSLRDYLSYVEDQDRNTIDWLELLNSATGWFDMAFTENVLESLAFDWGHAEGPKAQTGQSTMDQNRPELEDKDVKWWCINGGTSKLPQKMEKLIKKPVRLNTRVVSVKQALVYGTENNVAVETVDDQNPSKGSNSENFATVINTTTLGALQKIDLTGLNLPYSYKTAIRSLRYDTSTKVGVKFKYPWWIKDGGIRGGLGKTDLPLRVCVYPSYNINDPQDKEAVLLCSYTWGQDSERVASLVTSDSPKGEEKLKELMLYDLARLHAADGEFDKMYQMIKDNYIEHHAFDWSKDPYSSGAFALFSPGQFQELYATLVHPVADGRFHIVGEAASAHHAWIVGALDSAYRGVYHFLERFKLYDLQKRLIENFNTCPEVDYELAHLIVALGMNPEPVG